MPGRLSKPLYSRCEIYVCHLCKSKSEICQMTEGLINKVLTNPLSFLPSSGGELTKQAKKEIKQLELIHEIKPQLTDNSDEFRMIFKRWSKGRLEIIDELTKCVGQVVKAKTGTNVVKACGQAASIIGGILAIGGVLLAPETGGLSLSAWGIRVHLASRGLCIGADIADGVFSHIQSKRVAALIEKDRRETEKMEVAVSSLMSTSKLFTDVVREFEKNNQWFGMQELSDEVQQLKLENSQAQTALEVVAKSLKTGLSDKVDSKTIRGVSGFLIGIYVLKDALDFIQTIKDIQNGSKSDLEESILALTAVLIREHEILQKQYDSLG